MPEGLWAPLVRCRNDLVGLANDLVELCRADPERSRGKLGALIALGEPLIEARILLRQNHRFVRDTIVVEIAKEQPSEYSIAAFTGENDPSAVA